MKCQATCFGWINWSIVRHFIHDSNKEMQWHVNMSTCQHRVDMLTWWYVSDMSTCQHVNIMLTCWHGDMSLQTARKCSDLSPCQHINIMFTWWHVTANSKEMQWLVTLSKYQHRVDMVTCHWKQQGNAVTCHPVKISTLCWHVDMSLHFLAVCLT